MKKLNSIFWWVIFAFNFIVSQDDVINKFCTSFINSYELSGRYTHEYHPYILDKAKDSFLELQQNLTNNGFDIKGHEIILGYQEDAIVPYQTQWNRVMINDEAIVKKHAGLCSPVKNLFGFITGFILKDAQWLYNRWHPGNIKIEHVLANQIELFNDYALIFQKHAFGKDFDYFIKIRDKLERSIYKDDLKEVLENLVNFWTSMYEQFSRSGSNEIIATQDLVFTIDYAKALLNEIVNLNKIFVGPDITYPIEILAFQKQRATANAQKFVKQIVEDLKPIEEENTAYFFCSYVDGVGKSTLLNNIKNYQLFGFDFNKYARCDNSSSQLAEVYELKDKVFLVDMPAQMSHFVAEPDGYVFADVDTVKDLRANLYNKAIKYISADKNRLIESFLLAKDSIKKTNFKLCESKDYIEQYIQNCVLLNIDDTKWIPFEFEGNYFLFNKNSLAELKVLTPISETHSKGLKEVYPEMMLFSKGMSFPMEYEKFLKDLNDKLREANIKNVIFIDFLSMYPRSSRENVRLNFMIQYLTQIFKANFKMEDSFYQHKVYPEQEIFHKLAIDFNKSANNLVFETAFRWTLFDLINGANRINDASLKDFEKVFSDAILNFIDQNGTMVQGLVINKLKTEKKLYENKYSLDKTYENIVRFSWEPLVYFSNLLAKLFAKEIVNDNLNFLWDGLAEDIEKLDIENGEQVAILRSGEKLDIKFKIHHSSKEQDKLDEILKTLRAQWYAVLENLLNGRGEQDKIVILNIRQNAPPLVIKQFDNHIYILQKKFDLLSKEAVSKNKLKPSLKYHVTHSNERKKRWGVLNDIPYCIDWDNFGTYFGIYSYGYFPFKSISEPITNSVYNYQINCFKEGCQNWGMPISNLYAKVAQENKLESLRNEISKKEGLVTLEQSDSKIPCVRLWAKLIGTLEMIAKDLNSEILVRKGNQQDFASCLKLLEITLGKYYLLNFKSPLFDDYDRQEPFVSWDIINQA